jgi:hypothetical protein
MESGDSRAHYREGRARPIRPAMLTQKGVQTLLRVKQLMDEADSQMSAAGTGAQSGPPRPPASTPRTADTLHSHG